MNYRNFFKLFSIGAIGYSILEIIWRGYTHWSMAITGGFCFTFLCRLYRIMSQFSSIIKKCICGSIVITATEFISGLIFNKCLKLKVWNYSRHKFNIIGQICPFFSFLWFVLCLFIIPLCSFLNKKVDLM